MTDPRGAQHPRAIRLIVEYDGDELRVRDQIPVETPTPPSDPVRGFEGEAGFWVEVQGPNGDLLYRRVLEDPMRNEVESFDPELGIRRHEVEQPKGAFSVVVPDLPDARAVVVMGSRRARAPRGRRPEGAPPPQPTPVAAAEQLGRFELRKRGGPG